MSETPKKVDLDDALREWPDAEKSPMEWEERAEHLVARVRSEDRDALAATAFDENFLAAPLGQTDEDGHNSASPFPGGATARTDGAPGSQVPAKRAEGSKMTMSADRERDRRSLQDLAKMAQMTPPPPSVKSPPSGVLRAAEAEKDDSGIVDLAAAAASDPAASARAQSTPLASAGLFDEDPASVRPGPVAAQPVPTIPPMPASMPPASLFPASMPPASMGPVSAAPSSLAAAQAAPISSIPRSGALPAASSSQVAPVAPKKGNGAVIALVLGGVVALGAAAAGGFLYLRSQQATTAATGPVAMAEPAPAPQPAAPASAEAQPAAEDTDTTPAPEATMDPGALPTAAPANAKLAAAAPKGAAKAATPAKPAAKAEAPKEEAKLSQKDLPPSPSGPAGDLGAAMKDAVGTTDNKPQPAAAATGSQFAAGAVPRKPSQGAVTGAIGAVLREARACLGPDDPVSRATIVFASAGNVQNVTISGGAAGKPAEACIRSALMKAKVAPFAEPTYSAPITIRH